jgi:hypothetical protein
MNLLVVIVVILLLFGGGGGYYGYHQWGPTGGGVSVLGVLLICLVLWLIFGRRDGGGGINL